jgi:hypothetical protein
MHLDCITEYLNVKITKITKIPRLESLKNIFF